MSKADVIEVEGTVVEKLPKCIFQGGVREWTSDFSNYQRKTSHELYSHFTG